MANNAHIFASLTLLAAFVFGGTSAQALTMKECSAKYKAAQTEGTLKGATWNEFRKNQCGSSAVVAPAAATPPAPTQPVSPSPSSGATAIFPTVVSPKYSNESAGKARMHTCLDQYKTNKTSGGNGGLTWIKKGGGYYSECNKRLKS